MSAERIPEQRSGPPELRWYQRAGIDAATAWHAHNEGHCLVVVPTGSGKSHMLGALAAEAIAVNARVLVIAHRKELIDQNMRAMGGRISAFDLGVVSAQHGRKERGRPVTIGAIQTMARSPYSVGPFDLILIDEAHLVPRADSTQFKRFLEAQHRSNPNVRIVGFTATPFRLDSGRLDAGEDAMFDAIAYTCDIPQLIKEGYLCPLISKATLAQYDTAGVAMRGGEYIAGALEQRVNDPETTTAVVEELLALAHDRKKWLVFAAGVAHAQALADALTAHGIPAAAVHGGLSKTERADRLHRFHTGELRALTNCDLLTTGFDEPAIDCVALCRPTGSAGLHVQMCGRGFRIHPSKANTLVLDFAGNCLTHGPVDAIVVRDKTKRSGTRDNSDVQTVSAKVCPGCREIVSGSVRICPACDHAFPPPEGPKIANRAHMAPVISTEKVPPRWEEVTDVEYSYHEPREKHKPPTLRVEYKNGYRRIASEWVCLEHTGFAREKAETWWAKRMPDDEAPRTIESALAQAPYLRKPAMISTEPEGKYTRIAGYRWPKLAPVTGESGLPRACWTCDHNQAGICMLAGEAPPDDVVVTGCELWSDHDPVPF